MSQPLPDRMAREEIPDPSEIVRVILQETGTLSQLMEVHYLVQEPGLLDIVRALAALADDDRATLHEYLRRHSRDRLTIRALPNGALMILKKRKSSGGNGELQT